MSIHRNPIDDKVRSARKRYGDQAALWGLLTALYATGRDAEADAVLGHRWLNDAKSTLDKAMSLPDLGRAGEGLVGWAAHRYHLAERAADNSLIRQIEQMLPRAAYPVMAWTQRARPRPNLFDYSVLDAYSDAQEFLGSKAKAPVRQGPVVYEFSDGWTVQDLNTKSLLVDEGNHQHICVGQEQHGYPQRVSNGEIKIYSLRNPEGQPHATMTWNVEEKRLTEASAAYNENIEDDDARRRLVDFGRSLGASDTQLVLAGLLAARDADLRGANLRGAVLFEANLSNANLSNATLYRAYMYRANLSNANLSNANLRYADLRNADLRGAELRNADLRNTDLRGVNLRGAVYSNQTAWPKSLSPEAAGAKLIEE